MTPSASPPCQGENKITPPDKEGARGRSKKHWYYGLRSTIQLRRQFRKKLTPAEFVLHLQLKSKRFGGIKFRRQHGIGPFIVDFYCPAKKAIIEVDGDVHGLPSQKEKDQQREKYLTGLGFKILRYTNEQILKNLEGVLQDLYNKIILKYEDSH